MLNKYNAFYTVILMYIFINMQDIKSQLNVFNIEENSIMNVLECLSDI